MTHADGLGVRFLLLRVYFEQEDYARIREVCAAKFQHGGKGNGSLQWDLDHPYMAWSRVLVQFLQYGATPFGRTLLSAAMEACPSIPSVLFGSFKDPVQYPYVHCSAVHANVHFVLFERCR